MTPLKKIPNGQNKTKRGESSELRHSTRWWVIHGEAFHNDRFAVHNLVRVGRACAPLTFHILSAATLNVLSNGVKICVNAHAVDAQVTPSRDCFKKIKGSFFPQAKKEDEETYRMHRRDSATTRWRPHVTRRTQSIGRLHTRVWGHGTRTTSTAYDA